MSLTGVWAAWVVSLHERHDPCGVGWRAIMEEGQQHDHHQRYASVRARLRETPRTSTGQRYAPDALARAVPHEGQAYCSLPALACGIRLVVLDERGWVVSGYAFDDIAYGLTQLTR